MPGSRNWNVQLAPQHRPANVPTLKAMRHSIALVLGLCAAEALAQSTEYIRNGSFENGSMPTKWAQFDGEVADWETNQEILCISEGDEYVKYIHSPDYFDVNMNYNLSDNVGGQRYGTPVTPTVAGAGTRFVGIGAYEMVFQDYGGGLAPGNHYTISLEVMLNDLWPSFWDGSGEIVVGLAKQKPRYEHQFLSASCPNLIPSDQEVCKETYINYCDGGTQDIDIIGTRALTLSDFPPGEGWRRISFSFRAPDDIDSRDWIFIDVRYPSFAGAVYAGDGGICGDNVSNAVFSCNGDYLYIDQVSMKDAEFCDSPCSPELGPITYWRLDNGPLVWNSPPTGVIVGGSAAQSFYFYVENAIGIDFSVVNSWGEVIYNQYAFDPDGLKDVGYDDFFFSWTGEDYDGNFLYDDLDAFVYNLRLWNCNPGATLNYIGNELTYTPSNLNNVQDPYIPDYELEDCCQDHAYFQNTTFTGFSRTDVHDFITAGTNVTSGTPGPVLVGPASFVIFHAGNAINLEPGFSVAAGGEFVAVISDCIYGELRSAQSSNRPWLEPETLGPSLQSSMRLKPNPVVDGSVDVVLTGMTLEGGERIVLWDLSGVEKEEHRLASGQTVLRLEGLDLGVYLVELHDQQGNLLAVQKLVVL